MEAIYGIDLGTSNCLTARVLKVFDDIEVHSLIDKNGNDSFASVVHFVEEDEVIVGDRAKLLLPEYPDRTVEYVKLRLGKEKTIQINTENGYKYITPQEVTALLLRHFNVLHQNQIKTAVLTVPAHIDENQKSAVLEAGKLAGIEIIDIFEEPSAAVMYHLFNQYKSQGNIQLRPGEYRNYLVFDFGGGTLDLSIIKVELDEDGNVKPSVIAKDGDSTLGGNVIDNELTRWFLEELKIEYGDTFIREALVHFNFFIENKYFRSDIDPNMKQFLLRLKNTAEYVKVQLSSQEEQLVEVGRLEYKNFTIERSDFEEEILEPIFKFRVIKALETLKSKNTNDEVIDEVLLVGGTSQIPYFEKLIATFFEELADRITIIDEYRLAVAKGAAILGAIASGIYVPPFGNNLVYNTVSHNIFVNNTLLIERGLPYPFKYPKIARFQIKHALQTSILIKIFEEYEVFDRVKQNRVNQRRMIKKIKFYHPFFYRGETITIHLQIDHYGLLSFKAIHDDTNEEIDFKLDHIFSLSEEEFQKARERISRIKDRI